MTLQFRLGNLTLFIGEIVHCHTPSTYSMTKIDSVVVLDAAAQPRQRDIRLVGDEPHAGGLVEDTLIAEAWYEQCAGEGVGLPFGGGRRLRLIQVLPTPKYLRSVVIPTQSFPRRALSIWFVTGAIVLEIGSDGEILLLGAGPRKAF